MAETLLKQSWTNVIFEGKNKSYGAFELRALYNTYISRALIIAVIIFSIAISAPLVMSMLNLGKEEEDVVQNVEITLEAPPPVDPKTPPPPPPPQIEMPKVAAAVKFLPPKVEEDEKVQDEDPPTVDDMKDKQISTENREGEKTAVDVIEEAPRGNVIEEPKEPEFFLTAEEMPEFEGGMAGLYKFIGNNIQYPKIASQQGIEGRVIVSFIVNTEGMITNPEVVKGIGGGCDEEAIRVLKMVPKWKKVAKQNGRPVPLKYTMPIKFTLNN